MTPNGMALGNWLETGWGGQKPAFRGVTRQELPTAAESIPAGRARKTALNPKCAGTLLSYANGKPRPGPWCTLRRVRARWLTVGSSKRIGLSRTCPTSRDGLFSSRFR
jgi:hypothetical protein